MHPQHISTGYWNVTKCIHSLKIKNLYQKKIFISLSGMFFIVITAKLHSFRKMILSGERITISVRIVSYQPWLIKHIFMYQFLLFFVVFLFSCFFVCASNTKFHNKGLSFSLKFGATHEKCCACSSSQFYFMLLLE